VFGNAEFSSAKNHLEFWVFLHKTSEKVVKIAVLDNENLLKVKQ
jgi:hypothetical protein